jgi:hypothetical protein
MPKIIDVNGKKKQVFDPNDPEDMRIANELAEKQRIKIDVKVDSDAIKAKEAQLDAKLQEAEEGQKLFSELRSKLEEEYESEGLSAPRLETNEDLNVAVQNLREFQSRGKSEVPSGNAPLNRGQITGGSGSEGFDSMEELIDSVRQDAHSGNSDAQKILDALFIKTLKGVKENEKGIATYKPNEDSESEIQRLNRNFREKRHKRAINELREEY